MLRYLPGKPEVSKSVITYFILNFNYFLYCSFIYLKIPVTQRGKLVRDARTAVFRSALQKTFLPHKRLTFHLFFYIIAKLSSLLSSCYRKGQNTGKYRIPVHVLYIYHGNVYNKYKDKNVISRFISL